MTLMLEGLKVLDLATMLAGPLSATLLADFGADVIKIEKPVEGDPFRQMLPHKDGAPLWFKTVNRNKRGITLDIRKPEGQELFKRLVRDADVVIENFRPGTLERWNIGWDALREVNPNLVMLRTTGFGQYGPYKDKPGFGRVAEAYSGMAHITGFPDRAPIHAGFPLADSIAGLFGALSVTSALLSRKNNPDAPGEYIDVSLYESMFRLIDFTVIEYDQLGVVRERLGNTSDFAAPVGTWPTGDNNWASITCSTQTIVDRLFRAMDMPELSEDPRFATNDLRIRHRDELDAIVGEWCLTKTLAQIEHLFEQHEVTFAPILSIADIFKDEHYAAREDIVTVDDPELGSVRMQNVVPKFSRSQVGVRTSAPTLGQDNEAIFERQLGLSREDTDQLRMGNVI